MQTKQREDGCGIAATEAAFRPDPEIGHGGRRSSDPAARPLYPILGVYQTKEQLSAVSEVQRFEWSEESLVRSLDGNREMKIADRSSDRSGEVIGEVRHYLGIARLDAVLAAAVAVAEMKSQLGRRWNLFDQAGPALLQTGTQRMLKSVPGTGSWDTYKRQKFGEVTLRLGRHRVTIKPEGPVAGSLMDLKSVELVPVR